MPCAAQSVPMQSQSQAESEPEPDQPLESQEAEEAEEPEEPEEELPLQPPSTALAQRFDPSAFFGSDDEASGADSVASESDVEQADDDSLMVQHGEKLEALQEETRMLRLVVERTMSPPPTEVDAKADPTDAEQQYFKLFRAYEELRGVGVELSRLNAALEAELESAHAKVQQTASLRAQISQLTGAAEKLSAEVQELELERSRSQVKYEKTLQVWYW
eukprot:SAG31_NODE_628_length_13432_cov_131.456086_5_plen_218_part_00